MAYCAERRSTFKIVKLCSVQWRKGRDDGDLTRQQRKDSERGPSVVIENGQRPGLRVPVRFPDASVCNVQTLQFEMSRARIRDTAALQ